MCSDRRARLPRLRPIATLAAALVLLMTLRPVAAAPCSRSGEWLASLPLAPAASAADLQRIWRAAGYQRLWGVAENLSLGAADADGGPLLRLRYPAGSYVPSATAAPRGGAGFLAPLLRHEGRGAVAACLRYQLRVPSGFRFVKGGKLPGLYGGDAPGGGKPVDGIEGFSMRLMWRSGGDLEAYAYIANAAPGTSIGRGVARLQPGRWTTLELELRLNRPDSSDGSLALWVDGDLKLERHDLAYRRSLEIAIDGLMFSSFFGGDDPSWASPVDQVLEFRDFQLFRPR
ncbi:MAG: hypothetical protein JWQ90_5092 [Hydrocarboniphaga sp.]|uniref:polysaccharide lyase n=1 Tax=Hydrocarboniphaga sp. TaxID=2033016 RepID=UPI00261817A0|nr:hypothetical protein [Hydrocarboniphaga sp.]MDB5972642.1 hypothetical protein [Hydrocarboniphaga sp.]